MHEFLQVTFSNITTFKIQLDLWIWSEYGTEALHTYIP